MASIDCAIDRIRDNPPGPQPTRIEQIYRERRLLWRKRELDPATTIALFIRQTLTGNAPCSDVRHLAGDGATFTAQARCQAHTLLPLAVYRSLLSEVIKVSGQ